MTYIYKCSSPTPPPSPPLSSPLFKKRSVLLSNSKKKKTAVNPDLFDCSDYFYQETNLELS